MISLKKMFFFLYIKVVACSGNSGHNVEYVLRLADWMRETLPKVKDDHLYTIELHIRHIIKERNLCLKSMMNDENCNTHKVAPIKEDAETKNSDTESDSATSDSESTTSNTDFSSKVLNKKLRCVKV